MLNIENNASKLEANDHNQIILNPLEIAISKNYLNAVDFENCKSNILINDFSSVRDKYENNLWDIAFSNNDEELIDALIKYSKTSDKTNIYFNIINIPNFEGNTPLHIAASCKREDLIPILIENGANINAINAWDRTPLHEAIASDCYMITLETLLAPEHIDKQDIEGNTPIHTAIINGVRFKSVEMLLKKGFDLNKTNRDGNTPLHLAAIKSKELFNLVLSYNGYNQIKNNDEKTPVSIIKQRCDLDDPIIANYNNMSLCSSLKILNNSILFITLGSLAFDIYVNKIKDNLIPNVLSLGTGCALEIAYLANKNDFTDRNILPLYTIHIAQCILCLSLNIKVPTNIINTAILTYSYYVEQSLMKKFEK